MADAITVSGPISGTDRTLSFETGKLAGQADGAVVGRIGDTMILVTATASKGVREGTDFFPLTVDIEERMYAIGKIPGSFFRREGKAPDQAILTDQVQQLRNRGFGQFHFYTLNQANLTYAACRILGIRPQDMS